MPLTPHGNIVPQQQSVSEHTVTLDDDFLNVWPIYPHFLLLMSISIRTWLVLSHMSSFDVTSGDLMLKMLGRHLLANVCSLFLLVSVVRYVSDLRGMTDFTFVLNTLSLLLREKTQNCHTGLGI